jgi:hypothetical protein
MHLEGEKHVILQSKFAVMFTNISGGRVKSVYCLNIEAAFLTQDRGGREPLHLRGNG